MSEERLATVEVGPRDGARASVVWLHGLGADGHDFEPIVRHLGLTPERAVRFVFPTAPAIPVTINGGMVMPAWYDIRELDLRRRHDEEGVLRSARRVRALVDRERERGVSPDAIVLAGFSQGGAIALEVALRLPEPIAGVVALSTYLVRGDALADELSPAQRTTPVFMGHGTRDPMVPMERGERARDRLLELGLPVRWRSYGMQHEVCLEEIADVGAFLDERLPA